MARQIITVLTDDIDGSTADRTIEFGLDGVAYTIDLSEENIAKLRQTLEPYVTVATRVSRAGVRRGAPAPAQSAPTRTSRAQNQAIRDWAAQNGYELSDRGRIPANIVTAYNNR
ncbi:histone-like nucleoid-structuring protein Lsr2 [Symbioplanes lichenis]|uniref:histone-like nucleoid-structuring protein Lsr2 n=1 Tax=Symbioplanes lichenis TaxID=1629072 RepID=UPI0027396833|nr:Lsr2 family protein [Actinoplanes lichenis]